MHLRLHGDISKRDWPRFNFYQIHQKRYLIRDYLVRQSVLAGHSRVSVCYNVKVRSCKFPNGSYNPSSLSVHKNGLPRQSRRRNARRRTQSSYKAFPAWETATSMSSVTAKPRSLTLTHVRRYLSTVCYCYIPMNRTILTGPRYQGVLYF